MPEPSDGGVMAAGWDVVVVGGGIAGCAIASRLAGAGLGVLVLEAQETYRDRVRGETIMPWGVREVRRLGIEDVLLGAGGEYMLRSLPYDDTLTPAEAEARAVPFAALAPDVPGALNVGHPEACAALAAHAAARGATVARGVEAVKVVAGDAPSVRWSDRLGEHEAACRLIVGADGRGSSVRRQLGIELSERPAVTYGAGVLVRDPGGFAAGNVIGSHGAALSYAFPRSDGVVRLYLLVDIARKAELSGPSRLERFLASYPSDGFPASASLASGAVLGPCGGAPMTDSWTLQAPVVPGAVLIGDAAGWNDPIIGQGLSIALRDARSVADVLRSSDDWSPGAFGEWVDERAERMRRLAACAGVHTAMRCSFTEEGRRRRRRWLDALTTEPLVRIQAACCYPGPEAAPPAAFTERAIAATLAL